METPPLSNPNGHHTTDWLDRQLRILATGCPHTKDNPDGCPLHGVRQLEPAAIIAWLDELSSEEKDFLILYHQCCLVINRERDFAPRPSGRGAAPRRRFPFTAPPPQRRR